MSRMFKQTLLSGVSDSELISLVKDPVRMYRATPDDYEELVDELAERLESITYMVQETLDGQESRTTGLVGDPQ